MPPWGSMHWVLYGAAVLLFCRKVWRACDHAVMVEGIVSSSSATWTHGACHQVNDWGYAAWQWVVVQQDKMAMAEASPLLLLVALVVQGLVAVAEAVEGWVMRVEGGALAVLVTVLCHREMVHAVLDEWGVLPWLGPFGWLLGLLLGAGDGGSWWWWGWLWGGGAGGSEVDEKDLPPLEDLSAAATTARRQRYRHHQQQRQQQQRRLHHGTIEEEEEDDEEGVVNGRRRGRGRRRNGSTNGGGGGLKQEVEEGGDSAHTNGHGYGHPPVLPSSKKVRPEGWLAYDSALGLVPYDVLERWQREEQAYSGGGGGPGGRNGGIREGSNGQLHHHHGPTLRSSSSSSSTNGHRQTNGHAPRRLPPVRQPPPPSSSIS